MAGPTRLVDDAIRGPVDALDAGRVVIEALCDATGRVRIPIASSQGVLGVRMTPWGAYLVGTGAHPIGDDRLSCDVHVGPRASLELRSLGATLARRGPHGGTSEMVTSVRIDEGGRLTSTVEPGIAAAGSSHRSHVVADLAETAQLLVLDQIQLGRHGEAPGSWTSSIRITRAHRPVLDHHLELGPSSTSWASPAGSLGATALMQLVVVDVSSPCPTPGASALTPTARAVVTGGSGGAPVVITAWGDDLASCRRALLDVVDQVGLPLWCLKSLASG